MKKHYDLQLAGTDIAGVSVRFWSSEKCKLEVIRGKFLKKKKKSDEYSVALTAIFLENDWRDCFFTFPKEKHSYTSLNFIVKDKAHKTQYAVQLPLDGTSPKFTEMLYGE